MPTNFELIQRKINLINDVTVLRLLLTRYMCIALDDSDGVGYMKIMNEIDKIIKLSGGGSEEKEVKADRENNEEVSNIPGKKL